MRYLIDLFAGAHPAERVIVFLAVCWLAATVFGG